MTSPGESLRSLADSFWDTFLADNPAWATVIGDRRFDDRLQDTLAMLKLLAQSVDSIARGRPTSSSEDVRRRAHGAIDRVRRR